MLKVKTIGPGWLTPEQDADPQFKGPVQGKTYLATERVNWPNGEVSKHIVNVDLDGITWAIWLKPGDQFEGELVGEVQRWISAHEDGTIEAALSYLDDGTVCGCCGVDFGEEV